MSFIGIANSNAGIHSRPHMVAVFQDASGKITTISVETLRHCANSPHLDEERRAVARSLNTPGAVLPYCDKYGDPLTPEV